MTLLDTHVHVWDTAVLDYPWLAAADLPARCGPGDVDRAGGLSTRMIFVEADRAPGQGLAEARWAAGLDWPERAGIVAHTDLRADDLDRALDALQGLEGVVGVRQLLQSEEPGQWAPDALAQGLRQLAHRGLTFDACVRHAQLPALAALLERAPEAHVVLDHLGKPPLDAGPDSPAGRAWRAAMARIAALPRTYVKLSGLAAETTDAAAYARHAPAFVAVAVAAFSPARCMIGSDWPVSARTGVGTSFADWAELVRRATGAAGPEWRAIAETTGAGFYGIG